MTDTQETGQPTAPLGREETLERIGTSHAALERMVDGLSDQQLAATGPDGWSAADHLAPLAGWEGVLLAMLEGRPPYPTPDGEPGDIEEMNAALYARHASLAPAEARRQLAESHARLLAALGAMSDDDLQRPYGHFQPATRRE